MLLLCVVKRTGATRRREFCRRYKLWLWQWNCQFTGSPDTFG